MHINFPAVFILGVILIIAYFLKRQISKKFLIVVAVVVSILAMVLFIFGYLTVRFYDGGGSVFG